MRPLKDTYETVQAAYEKLDYDDNRKLDLAQRKAARRETLNLHNQEIEKPLVQIVSENDATLWIKDKGYPTEGDSAWKVEMRDVDRNPWTPDNVIVRNPS
ncbi:MAG: hypothetical protein EZS28_037590 [Streblomastix strix]|uniref:Uncharacterized protein n=1 Tax=Streblomastix strix TaxID=222440 RepID=A0A5J4UAF3_9EUKA|nr:MAG: hypothetical protein EZS28_037590 [Streblomastix strix]